MTGVVHGEDSSRRLPARNATSRATLLERAARGLLPHRKLGAGIGFQLKEAEDDDRTWVSRRRVAEPRRERQVSCADTTTEADKDRTAKRLSTLLQEVSWRDARKYR